MKYTVIGLTCAVLLAGCQSGPSFFNATQSSSAAMSSTGGTIAKGLSIIDKTVSENHPTYSINAVIPQIQGLKDAHTLSDINAQLTQIVQNQISSFNQDNTGITLSDLASNQEQPYSLDISYKPVFLNDRMISIRLDDWVYTGGAHRNGTVITFNYDVAGKRLLHLDDLFQPQSNYLQRLSTLSIPKVADYLEQQSGTGSVDVKWISDGAGPSADNFQTFNVTDQGIQFIFDPYQVAAFAYGEPQVMIRYDEIQDVLSDRMKKMFNMINN